MTKNKPTLEDAFLAAWKREFPQLPEPARQHPIRNPETGRDWRLDFCFVPERLFIEIQGGAAFGRHLRPAGQAKDYERHNYLTGIGWRGLYFNTLNLRCMVDAVTIVAEVLCKARPIDG